MASLAVLDRNSVLNVAMQIPDLITIQAIQRAENKRKIECGGKSSTQRFHVLALDWFPCENSFLAILVMPQLPCVPLIQDLSSPSAVKIYEDIHCLSQSTDFAIRTVFFMWFLDQSYPLTFKITFILIFLFWSLFHFAWHISAFPIANQEQTQIVWLSHQCSSPDQCDYLFVWLESFLLITFIIIPFNWRCTNVSKIYHHQVFCRHSFAGMSYPNLPLDGMKVLKKNSAQKLPPTPSFPQSWTICIIAEQLRMAEVRICVDPVEVDTDWSCAHQSWTIL